MSCSDGLIQVEPKTTTHMLPLSIMPKLSPWYGNETARTSDVHSSEVLVGTILHQNSVAWGYGCPAPLSSHLTHMLEGLKLLNTVDLAGAAIIFPCQALDDHSWEAFPPTQQREVSGKHPSQGRTICSGGLSDAGHTRYLVISSNLPLLTPPAPSFQSPSSPSRSHSNLLLHSTIEIILDDVIPVPCSYYGLAACTLINVLLCLPAKVKCYGTPILIDRAMASACSHFRPNLWRPTTCANCFFPKARHAIPEAELAEMGDTQDEDPYAQVCYQLLLSVIRSRCVSSITNNVNL